MVFAAVLSEEHRSRPNWPPKQASGSWRSAPDSEGGKALGREGDRFSHDLLMARLGEAGSRRTGSDPKRPIARWIWGRRPAGSGSSIRWTAPASTGRAGRTGQSTWPWPLTGCPWSVRWRCRPLAVVLGTGDPRPLADAGYASPHRGQPEPPTGLRVQRGRAARS